MQDRAPRRCAAPGTAQNPLHLRNQPLRLVQPAFLTELSVARHVEHDPECVDPKVTQAVWPDALCAHPVEFRQYVADIALQPKRISVGHARPGVLRPSGVTALVSSNQTNASNCCGSEASE